MIDKELLEKCYSIAREARSVGLDPSESPEITPAPDLAARVEGIVGPPGIAEKIRKKKGNRIQVAFQIAEEILNMAGDVREKVEQAVRTGTAILTEGVLVAPTEGIASVEIDKNPSGNTFLRISYAGPIRAAGGTAAALSALLADFVRRKVGIGIFEPTETIVERYYEEINLYDARGARLQYRPSEEDTKWIVTNCPVCIDGEPTEDFEVSAFRNVPGIKSNRVRGGMALVICEGIAQKAAKIFTISRKLGIDWGWLEKIITMPKSEKEKKEVTPSDKYLDEIVAGRPIFSYPSRKGGFRLRYGRTRMTGIHARAISPATMIILDSFPATGTQLKVERPGKSCVLTPCSNVEGPVVKLYNGDVLQINNVEEAIKVKEEVEKILFLGDILTSYGDFLKTSTPLLPAGYCEEWWERELEEAVKNKNFSIPQPKSAEEAFKISEHLNIPLHPKYTYFWKSVSGKEIKELVEWLREAEVKHRWLTPIELKVVFSPAKQILEKALIPHRVEKDKIIIEGDAAFVLYKLKQAQLTEINEEEEGISVISKILKIKIRDKGGTWIGTRMGRPEKARERKMKPPVHVLFPIGYAGGKTRSLMKAYRDSKSGKESPAVEIARFRCSSCGRLLGRPKCDCGGRGKIERVCLKCGRPSPTKIHSCGGNTIPYDERAVDIITILDTAIKNCSHSPIDIKGVVGLMNDERIPEPMEKGVLRAKNGITVFKDGTCRFDATNILLTHFYPSEVGISIEKLRELGYNKDIYGKELKNENQLLALDPQDIIISERAAEYLLRVAQFIDDELKYIYKKETFYDAKKKEDLIGHLLIHLSPHTSCGILGRIIGFTKNHATHAHPYMFAASRRDCDGDENCIMLLMDGLLNFSRSFLPRTRGGSMDAPIVLMTLIKLKEVDDQVHAMEICKSLPIEFYEATQKFSMPSEVKLETVEDRIGTNRENEDLWFTHDVSSIHSGLTETRYITLKVMKEKIDAQLNLTDKICAADMKDAAERVILSHFLPDLYGNLRSFVRQQFRCVDCNKKYRRVPLNGKCSCGGKLILTISRGGVEKYLKISQGIVERYGLPSYLKQRLLLLEKDIKCLFEDETTKQFDLAEFM